MNPADACIELFRSSWSLYDTIVGHDYMFHREIHACVHNALTACARQGDYALLDLGCGNARWLADTLRTFPPTHYLGVDLSRAALDEAAIHLRALPSVELREQDLLACALDATRASFTVVYSGFAMHHLAAAEKLRLFQACAALLSPDGEFLLVDVVREEGQTRDQYLEDYLRRVRTEWKALAPEQVDEVVRHVTTHDFPETYSALAGMAGQAGFGQAHRLGTFGAHQVFRFVQPGSKVATP